MKCAETTLQPQARSRAVQPVQRRTSRRHQTVIGFHFACPTALQVPASASAGVGHCAPVSPPPIFRGDDRRGRAVQCAQRAQAGGVAGRRRAPCAAGLRPPLNSPASVRSASPWATPALKRRPVHTAPIDAHASRSALIGTSPAPFEPGRGMLAGVAGCTCARQLGGPNLVARPAGSTPRPVTSPHRRLNRAMASRAAQASSWP